MTCPGPGWGNSPYGTGPWGGVVLGGVPPANETFELFCIGPCEDMNDIGLYLMSTLTGSFSAPVGGDHLLLESSNGAVSSLFLDNAVPDSYTLEYTIEFDSMPPTNSFVSTHHVFVGAYEDSGASVGLFFSAAGIGLGTVLGEMVTPLPGGHQYVWEGGKFVVRIGVSLTNDVVFVYITPESEIAGGGGHKLRYVLTIPGTSAAASEGVTFSVLGSGANPVQIKLYTVCLGVGLAVPNRPPTADAGSYQELVLCTFGKLDGSASFDPEGAPLTYFWRLLDAPPTSASIFEGQGGFTAAGIGGFTDKFYSSELSTAHADLAIVPGDVLTTGGSAYSIIATGVDGNGFFAQISSFTLPELLTGRGYKLVRQAPVLTSPAVQRPSIYADASGVYRFGLIVSDGDLYSEEASVVVNVRESNVPRGVSPDTSFLWGYLSDFWSIVENKEPITAIWDALVQVVGAQLLTLWQVDYNKSIRDIQRTFQRRWLYYDLMLQEPFVELTSVGFFDTAAGDLSGAGGVAMGPNVYLIPDDLSAHSVSTGDFLVLSGEAYRIRTYLPASGGGSNSVQTDVDLPGGVADWRIMRTTRSTQIDFHGGLVVAGDIAVYEVRTIDTGEIMHLQTTVTAVSSEDRSALMADLTALVAYLTDDLYSVALLGVFRRTYAPVNDRIVTIPYLQPHVPTSSEEEILYHNVDYFLESFRGVSCIRFDPEVWQHEAGGVLVADLTPPARLWAEVTYFENLSTVEANFGTMVDFTRDQLAQSQSDSDYLSVVQGLWFTHLKGPTLRNLRVGIQILMGLPFAEETGEIESVDTEIFSGVSRVFVRDTDGSIVRMYRFPADVDLATNPATGGAYIAGDTVHRFAPLSAGVSVDDYISDPDWFRPWVGAGVMNEVEKYFHFVVRVDSSVYKASAIDAARKHLLMFRPTSTYPILVLSHTLEAQDIDVNDLMAMRVTLQLWEGTCLYNTFGVATMWDQPDPTPVRMSAPPDGGSVVYSHERLPGIFSGWMSAYDAPITVGRYERRVFISASMAAPLPGAGTALDPDPYNPVLDTAINHILFRATYDDANPWEATPLYEMVLVVNAVEQISLPFTTNWYQISGDILCYANLPVSPPVYASPGDNVQVIIRPAAGGSNSPSWKNVEASLWTAVGYTSPEVVWGFDDGSMCPEETCTGIVMCVWPGGLPDADPDNPLFGDPTATIFPASVVGGHITLDLLSPVAWAFGVALPAGVYGRVIVL